jgi:predicted metal-dependent hydrolase
MELDYTIKRTPKRRKLTITVERDRSVVVHAPVGTSDERIEEVVQSRRQWIYAKIRHAQKYQELPHPPGKELVSGESALYLGRNYRIEVIDEATEVHFDHRFVVPRQRAAKRKEVLREWYIAKAKEKILSRVTRQARDLGVDLAAARIVDNRYRWGSCTVKGNVNFNWRLIKAPMFVIDYVIVHELTHLIVANHTPRFWNIVRSQTPTMDKAKAWLKEHGQILEEDI